MGGKVRGLSTTKTDSNFMREPGKKTSVKVRENFTIPNRDSFSRVSLSRVNRVDRERNFVKTAECFTKETTKIKKDTVREPSISLPVRFFIRGPLPKTSNPVKEKNIAKTEVSSTRGFGRKTNATGKEKSSVKKELWFIREASSPVNRMEAEPNSVKMVRNSIRAIGRRA